MHLHKAWDNFAVTPEARFFASKANGMLPPSGGAG
jgi:hypothetical protein